MDCKVTHRTISAYADEELSLPHMRAVSSHLKACPACQERFRAVKTGGRMMSHLRDADVDSALEDRIVAYVAQNIDKQPAVERIAAQLTDWRVAAAAAVFIASMLYSAPTLVAHTGYQAPWAKAVVTAKERVDGAILASENAISNGAHMLISYGEPRQREGR